MNDNPSWLYNGSHPTVELEGSWEQKGRSPSVAATLGLLGIGIVYFNGQSLLLSFLFLLTASGHPAPSDSTDLFENIIRRLLDHRVAVGAVILSTQILLMLIPAVVLVRTWHTRTVGKYVRLGRLPITEVLLAVLITLSLIPASMYIAQAFTGLLPIPQKLLEANERLFRADSAGGFVWMVVVIALTPAVCEEFFFRGYVQRTFERTIGPGSVLVVGVAFGLYHLHPLGLVSLSILGLTLGYLFYRSRSLYPSMAAHFTNNFVVLLLSYISLAGPGAPHRLSLNVVLLGLALGFLGLVVFYHVTRERFRPGFPSGVVA